MADSKIDITEGSGQSIDTRTLGDGQHRQVVVLGDPSTTGGVAPVDGTAGVKVDLGSDNDVSLNAGTNAIGKLAANSGVDIGDVDVTSVPAPLDVIGGGAEATALRVTIANDSTGVLSVDDNAGSLTIDNAALSETGGGVEASALRVTMANDSTGVLSVDDNGGSLTVDGSGTFTVTDDGSFTLAANSGVDIGDVDVTSIVPGTGATNLGKAIDSASGATDTGVAPLAVRDDALSALTPAEGDYVPLRVNSTGALHITGAAAGTEFNVDDVAGGTDAGTAFLAIRDDSLTTLTPADGDYVRLRTNSTGALHVTGGGGGTEFNEDVAHTTGDAGGQVLAVRKTADTPNSGSDGDYSSFIVDSDRGALKVEIFDGGDSHTIDGTITASNTTGDAANDAADSGNPVKIGGKAETTTPSAVADGDRVDAAFDIHGNQAVFFGASLTYTSIDKTTTAAQDIVAAPGSNTHLRIYGYTISNEGTEQLTTTITSVAVFGTKDGSSINMVLPGYIDLASNTAAQATLSTTSTNGIVIGLYHRTLAD